MKYVQIAGMAVLALVTTSTYAYDITKETSEQKCERWAGQTNVDPKDKVQFLKDCLLDLRVPDENGGGGGE